MKEPKGFNEGRSRRPITVCTEPGARQSEAADCDINRIVNQFYKTGVMPMGSLEGIFEDVSAIGDFRAAQEKMLKAEEVFMTLPPAVRSRFENDALEFVEFATNPANRDELVKLGLVEEPKVPPVDAAAPPKGAASA